MPLETDPIPVPSGLRAAPPNEDSRDDAPAPAGVERRGRRRKLDLNELDAKKDAHEDWTERVNAALPALREQAKGGQLDSAIEGLYALEKLTRQGGDSFSTATVGTTILELLWDAGDYPGVNNHLVTLIKKRGQLKHAIISFVQRACEFVERLDDAVKAMEVAGGGSSLSTSPLCSSSSVSASASASSSSSSVGASDPAKRIVQVALIETIRSVSEGKIFVENERARLTLKLALMLEAEGKVKEAADMLQEVQVETYGAMERREKTAFILEQVRLCLDSSEYVRAQIMARKIAPKVLQADDFQDLKLQNARLMLRFHYHERNFLEMCRFYHTIYDTPSVQKDEASWREALRLLCAFLALTVYSNEQADLMNRTALEKNLRLLPTQLELVGLLLTRELLNWKRCEELFAADFASLPGYTPAQCAELWSLFQTRVVQHNLRVVESYYTRIRLDRLAELLHLSVAETEKQLSALVVDKMLWARIDRPRGIVAFRPQRDPHATVDEFGGDISQLMSLVSQTCHLISLANLAAQKEQSV